MMVSQARQLSFGRTCSITLNEEGTYLGDVVGDPAQHGPAATAAGCRRLVHQALARQVRGQRLAAARLAVGGLGPRRGRSIAPGLLDPRGTLRQSLLEVAEQELELLDLAVELFRGAAEARAAEHRQLRLEVLDLNRLGVQLGVAHRDRPLALGEQRLLLGDDALALSQQRVLLGEHLAQRAGVTGKLGSVRRHGLTLPKVIKQIY
jgi:hypothetical protein